MNEKTKTASKVRNSITEFFELLLVLLGIALLIIVFLLSIGYLLKLLWNATMPQMFDVNKITFFEAAFITFAIGFIKSNIFSNIPKYAKRIYSLINKKVESKVAILKDLAECSGKTYKRSRLYTRNGKILTTIILVALLKICDILIGIYCVIHCWNTILPHIFEYSIFPINFLQAIAIIFILKLVLYRPNNDKSAFEDEETEKETKEKLEKIFPKTEEEKNEEIKNQFSTITDNT